MAKKKKTSPADMAASMIANLKEKTGKTMAQWLKICKASKLEKHGQIVKHLKSEHGMTHGFANLVVSEFLSGAATAATKSDSKADDSLVDAQYSKGKEELRPIYDAIIAAIKKFGDDVEVAPKKAYVFAATSSLRSSSRAPKYESTWESISKENRRPIASKHLEVSMRWSLTAFASVTKKRSTPNSKNGLRKPTKIRKRSW